MQRESRRRHSGRLERGAGRLRSLKIKLPRLDLKQPVYELAIRPFDVLLVAGRFRLPRRAIGNRRDNQNRAKFDPGRAPARGSERNKLVDEARVLSKRPLTAEVHPRLGTPREYGKAQRDLQRARQDETSVGWRGAGSVPLAGACWLGGRVFSAESVALAIPRYPRRILNRNFCFRGDGHLGRRGIGWWWRFWNGRFGRGLFGAPECLREALNRQLGFLLPKELLVFPRAKLAGLE
jgi:hypothetical protein